MEKREIDYELRNKLFEQYIAPHQGYVYKICISRARAPDHVPELVNEVLIRLLKYIKTYDPSRHILPWIRTVTEHCITAIYSRGKIIINDYVDIYTIPSDKLYYEWNSDYVNVPFSPTVMAAIEMLRPKQKAAVLLQAQGCSVKQITVRLYENGVSQSLNDNTTKSTLYQARRRLSKLIDKQGNLKVPLPRKPIKLRPARFPPNPQGNTNPHSAKSLSISKGYRKPPTKQKPQKKTNMAKLKSESDKYITLHEKEYFDLIESKLLIEALKSAGLEELPIYKAANTILRNARVEIHLKPIEKR
jgi:DNA-directed RNA polymerase specialized sigma subunit, sigma24 homolog